MAARRNGHVDAGLRTCRAEECEVAMIWFARFMGEPMPLVKLHVPHLSGSSQQFPVAILCMQHMSDSF